MIVEEAEYLEHYGKLGMKWGTRKAARQENRALNKASRQKERQEHKKSVEKARSNVDTGKTSAGFKKAKAQYKKDKVKLGSREARKILNAKRDKLYKDIEKSQEAKDGKETALVVLGAVGFTLASALVTSALSN